MIISKKFKLNPKPRLELRDAVKDKPGEEAVGQLDTVNPPPRQVNAR